MNAIFNFGAPGLPAVPAVTAIEPHLAVKLTIDEAAIIIALLRKTMGLKAFSMLEAFEMGMSPCHCPKVYLATLHVGGIRVTDGKE